MTLSGSFFACVDVLFIIFFELKLLHFGANVFGRPEISSNMNLGKAHLELKLILKEDQIVE